MQAFIMFPNDENVSLNRRYTKYAKQTSLRKIASVKQLKTLKVIM